MSRRCEDVVFTVARGSVSLGRYFENTSDAFTELHRIQKCMREAMLEPDVWLAQVIRETTYGDPQPPSI